MNNKKVFIAHGHDSIALRELKEFLTSLGFEPIILFQQPNLGFAIVEKFEYYASQCVFAFILLTPDDKLSHELSGQEIWRARQNVILELGWFMHKVGRSKVILLHNGSVEIPSNISGVIYFPFTKSVYEVSELVRKELIAQGLL